MFCTTKNSDAFVLSGLYYTTGDKFNAKQECVKIL